MIYQQVQKLEEENRWLRLIANNAYLMITKDCPILMSYKKTTIAAARIIEFYGKAYPFVESKKT